MGKPIYYLAVDLGASSGRHILGYCEDGKMKLEEIYRFENGVVEKNGRLVWDTDRLICEIKNGMRRAKELGKAPSFMGIDTWGVDFVLLDEKGEMLGDAVSYRDARTEGVPARVHERVSGEELFRRTGIATQPYNTVYQLVALREQQPELLARAKQLLTIPCYFNYLLTGTVMSEYTHASTSQLVDAETKNWDYELIGKLCLPGDIFSRAVMPGVPVGRLTESVQKEVGFDTCVVLTACHDTASAVVAVPSTDEQFAYISSGTWSLFGTTLREPCICRESMKEGFSNEGGFAGEYRFLKNIMGLWMIQSARREWQVKGEDYSFAELCALAKEAGDIPSRVDVEDTRFLAPASMIAEVQAACRESGQPVPKTVAEIAAVIHRSLADCYARSLVQMEKLTGCHFSELCIVGGGSQAEYLNELTAAAIGRTVLAGPGEATAIGNMAVQMLTSGELSSLAEARAVIKDSFAVKTYLP